jgi:hypothetical protein
MHELQSAGSVVPLHLLGGNKVFTNMALDRDALGWGMPLAKAPEAMANRKILTTVVTRSWMFAIMVEASSSQI